MSKQGTYDVNSGGGAGGSSKDTSFRSFICALLVFLALCIAIYLALVLGRKATKTNEINKETEDVDGTYNDKSEKGRLTAINVPDDKEGKETTTHRYHTDKVLRNKTTPSSKTTTSSYGEEENLIPQFPDKETTVKSTTVIVPRPISVKTTTSSYVETENITSKFINKNEKVPFTEKTTRPSTTSTATPKTTSSRITTPRGAKPEENTTPWLVEQLTNKQVELVATTEYSRRNITDEETERNAIEQSTVKKFISEESSTTDLGIDHEIFHIKSSTEVPYSTSDAASITYTYNTTSRVLETTEESVSNTHARTTDKSLRIIGGGEENKTESVGYVTDNQLTTAENFQTVTESNVFSTTKDNRNVAVDFSSTESSNAKLVITTETQSQRPARQRYQISTESSTEDTEVFSTIQATTKDKVIVQTPHHSTTEMYMTPSFAPVTEDTTTRTKISAYQATTTELPRTTQQSPVNTAGIRTTADTYGTTSEIISTTEENISHTPANATYKYLWIMNAKGKSTTESGVHTTDSQLTTTENLHQVTGSTTLPTTSRDNRNIVVDLSTTESSDTSSVSVSEAERQQSTTRRYQITTDSRSETTESLSTVEATSEVGTTVYTVRPQTTETYTTPTLLKQDTTTQTKMLTTPPMTTDRSRTTEQSTIKIQGIKSSPVKECSTTICKKITSEMVSMMNHAADPCDNFYEFACGGQLTDDDGIEDINSEKLLLYMSQITASSETFSQEYRRFYESCVEHERYFNLSQRMEFLAEISNHSLTDLFVELILTQSMPLFDVGLGIGESQEYRLQLTLPGRSSLRMGVEGWSIPDQIRKTCMDEQKHLTTGSTVNLDNVYESYTYCQRRRLKAAARSFLDNMKPFVKDPSDTIFTDNNLSKMLNLLDNVQDLLPSESEIHEAHHINQTLIRVPVDELNKATKYVDLTTILERITFNSTFSKNDMVYVYISSDGSDYVVDALTTLQNTYTESELVEMLTLYSKFQLYENTVVPKNTDKREKYCLELSRQLMPDVVSTIVYELSPQKFLRKAIMKMNMLFTELKDQFGQSLSNSQLEETPRNLLLDKLKNVRLGLISTGDYNTTRKNYKTFTLKGNNYQENVVRVMKHYRNIIYSLERTQASASNLLTYFVDHFSTQPKSFYPSEYIVLHPAVFEKISVDIPKYLWLSKIGLHLSRELAKHFDPVGRRFLTSLQINFSNNYYDRLIQRTGDLLEHYANYSYVVQGKTLSFHINDSLLINEMIADNAAFRLIYDKFTRLKDQDSLPWIFDSYNIEKVFFVTAAQEYCKKTTVLDFLRDLYEAYRLPSAVKIQNIISNTEQFSKTFECADGSAMTIYEEMITQFPHMNYDEDDSSYSYATFYT